MTKMKEKATTLKDPGSAITHFIGMLMAIFAAVPLLIKAATIRTGCIWFPLAFLSEA